MFFINTALKPQYQDSHLKVNDKRWAYQSFLVTNLLQKIYNDTSTNNVSWPELCMLNCSSFAVVTYSVHMYLLLSTRVSSFRTFRSVSPTHTCKHTYIHTHIPLIQKFAKVSVRCGISHKHINVQNMQNIQNYNSTEYYRDVIHSVILKHEEFMHRVKGVFFNVLLTMHPCTIL
jgi:N12 class adenine-specific DNA methylase